MKKLISLLLILLSIVMLCLPMKIRLAQQNLTENVTITEGNEIAGASGNATTEAGNTTSAPVVIPGPNATGVFLPANLTATNETQLIVLIPITNITNLTTNPPLDANTTEFFPSYFWVNPKLLMPTLVQNMPNISDQYIVLKNNFGLILQCNLNGSIATNSTSLGLESLWYPIRVGQDIFAFRNIGGGILSVNNNQVLCSSPGLNQQLTDSHLFQVYKTAWNCHNEIQTQRFIVLKNIMSNRIIESENVRVTIGNVSQPNNTIPSSTNNLVNPGNPNTSADTSIAGGTSNATTFNNTQLTGRTTSQTYNSNQIWFGYNDPYGLKCIQSGGTPARTGINVVLPPF